MSAVQGGRLVDRCRLATEAGQVGKWRPSDSQAGPSHCLLANKRLVACNFFASSCSGHMKLRLSVYQEVPEVPSEVPSILAVYHGSAAGSTVSPIVHQVLIICMVTSTILCWLPAGTQRWLQVHTCSRQAAAASMPSSAKEGLGKSRPLQARHLEHNGTGPAAITTSRPQPIWPAT